MLDREDVIRDREHTIKEQKQKIKQQGRELEDLNTQAAFVRERQYPSQGPDRATRDWDYTEMEEAMCEGI